LLSISRLAKNCMSDFGQFLYTIVLMKRNLDDYEDF
jgi:hypothetical protein